MVFAEDLVSSGGPSAPAWAFFTAIIVTLLGILQQQLSNRSRLKALKEETEAAKNEAKKARESASKAEANTQNVSNGFVGRMDRKLDDIRWSQAETNKALREHLEWHLDKENH